MTPISNKRQTIDLLSTLGTGPDFSGSQKASSRRQQKHEMLVTFLANAKAKQPKKKAAAPRPRFLSVLLSFFF